MTRPPFATAASPPPQGEVTIQDEALCVIQERCRPMGYTRVPQRHNKQIAFLAALARGKTPIEAAQIVGLPWSTFYTWRRKHTRFRKAWDQARAYGATPEFPPPSVLAKMTLVPHDQPVRIEYRDMLARELCASHGWPLEPLPEPYVVTDLPEADVPHIEARIARIADAAERERERKRWFTLPPLKDAPALWPEGYP